MDYFLVAVFAFIPGLVIGAIAESYTHMPYCDCAGCKKARKSHGDKAIKQDSGV